MSGVMIRERRKHPNSADHEVVRFQTKVSHEICIDKDLPTSEIMQLITRYLRGEIIQGVPGGPIKIKGYEDHYPETAA